LRRFFSKKRHLTGRIKTLTHAINFVLSIIFTLAELVLEAIGIADAFLAALMTSAGLPPNLQIAVLIVVALMLVVFAIRALGGVFSVLLIILLVLLIAHRMFPGMAIPHSMLPAQWPKAGSVQI
jgi:hypothetical protein